jgi:hypothetical protein
VQPIHILAHHVLDDARAVEAEDSHVCEAGPGVIEGDPPGRWPDVTLSLC